jgi:hypothetical protein
MEVLKETQQWQLGVILVIAARGNSNAYDKELDIKFWRRSIRAKKQSYFRKLKLHRKHNYLHDP